MQTEAAKSEDGRPSHDGAKDYLASLQNLASEVDRAMNAIVQRELPSLQESLRRQQATCAELVHLRSRADFLQELQVETGLISPDLAEEIQAATASLLMLNKQYSALLKHSGSTLRLFLGLFRSFHGSVPASSLNPNLQTWSCEV